MLNLGDVRAAAKDRQLFPISQTGYHRSGALEPVAVQFLTGSAKMVQKRSWPLALAQPQPGPAPAITSPGTIEARSAGNLVACYLECLVRLHRD